MIVVSGCPRSGTSLMMRILGTALGEDRIVGEKFPQEVVIEAEKRRLPRETDAQYAYRQYALALDPRRIEEAHDMNPDGFWEGPFTVRGVYYRPECERLLSELLVEGDNRVCKIVSEALAHSEPRYIDRVILMVRHPRAVAKSQERLHRELRMKFGDGRVRDIYKDQVVHSPELFIDSALAALGWIAAHPDVPVLPVNYDDIIEWPVETVEAVRAFVRKVGDWDAAAREVKRGLRRSYPEGQASNFWTDAEDLYGALLRLDTGFARAFVEDAARATNRARRTWMCVRCEQPMNEAHCLQCQADPKFRASLEDYAKVNGIPWGERPCAWEVAYRPDAPAAATGT